MARVPRKCIVSPQGGFSHDFLHHLEGALPTIYTGESFSWTVGLVNEESDQFDSFFRLVYDELRRLAGDRMRREAPGQTLQPTALVHEVYLRLHRQRSERHFDRAYFFASAARAMRQILIERARRRQSQKRGGNPERITLREELVFEDGSPEDILTIHRLLKRLEQIDDQMAKLVELRYFGGLTIAEAAEVMNRSSRSLNRLWRAARAWFLLELEASE